MNFLLVLLVCLAYAAFFCQGPIVTALITTAWILRSRNRVRKLAFESGDSGESESEENPPGGGIYLFGLILASIGVLLDWVSLIADYLERYPASPYPSLVDSTETITRTIPFVSAFAFILAALGRAKGKALTLITSTLLVFGSLGLIVIEGCRHTSF